METTSFDSQLMDVAVRWVPAKASWRACSFGGTAAVSSSRYGGDGSPVSSTRPTLGTVSAVKSPNRMPSYT
ncbi:hypothetical protein [Streptomyces sp. NPDC049879]|uniref:hypothetical protein n=1 Tax=Streptomyces sp. NPDC049879 TaxID=3365598 RepID=UPI0037BDDCAE